MKSSVLMRFCCTIISIVCLMDLAFAQTITFDWVQGAGSNQRDRGEDIALDAAGDVVIAGFIDDDALFGTTSVPNSGGGRDVFIAKYTGAGLFNWARHGGGSGEDRGNGVVTDASGNIYVTGEFANTLTFDGLSQNSFGESDVYVVKYSSSGNIVWLQTFGGDSSDAPRRLAIDPSGNVYVTGLFRGDLRHNSSVLLTARGGADAFVIKLNPSGTVLRSIRIGGSGNDLGKDIKIDPSGNVIVGGGFAGVGYFDDSTTLSSSGGIDNFVARYNPNLDLIWARGYSAATGEGKGMATGPDGIYVGGHFIGTFSFAGTSLSASNTEVFVLKYDLNGNQVWAFQSNNAAPLEQIGLDVGVVNGTSTVVVTGDYSGSPLFGSKSLSSRGSYDVFVIGMNPANGNVLWAASAGGSDEDYGDRVEVGSDQKVYVTGRHASDDALFGTLPLDSRGRNDVFTTRLTIGNPTVTPTLTVTSPVSGDDWTAGTTHTIQWTMANAGSSVQISLYRGSLFQQTIASNVSGTTAGGSYSWAIPQALSAGNDYQIRITSLTESVADDYSEPFTISAAVVPSLVVTSPTSGDSWAAGTTRTIRWTMENAGSTVQIRLYRGSVFQQTIISSYTDATTGGTYSWAIPSSLAAGSDYRVRITSQTAPSADDYSDFFTITAQPPIASFSGSPRSGIIPLTVQFTDSSTPGSSAITSWSWDFGDGQTSNLQNPSHSYTAAGQYTVKLTVSDGNLSDMLTQNNYIIVSNPIKPSASFSGSPRSGLTPLTVQFNDTSVPGSRTITSWSWDFGDGQTSTLQNPSHTYTTAGQYAVKLTVSDGLLTDSVTQNNYVIVSDPIPPTAAFSGTPRNGVSPLTVQFTDASTAGSRDIVAWSWDFGDGMTSTAQNPSHTYTTSAQYTVKLTVSDGTLSDPEEKTNYITVGEVTPPSCDFTGSPTNGLAPLTVEFTDNSTPGTNAITSWSWDFGDGETSNLQSPSHSYESTGQYSVSLTVSDGNLTDTRTRTNYITVGEVVPPAADFTASPTTGFSPLQVQFIDASTPGTNTVTSWSWDFGDGQTSTEKNPGHTYNSSGIYTVSLTVKDNANLEDTETKASLIEVTDQLPPAPPQGLAVQSAGGGTVSLSWNANGEADFLRYRIYGGPASGSTTLIDSVNGINNTSRLISGLVTGNRYFFRITAVNSALQQSGFSNEVDILVSDQNNPPQVQNPLQDVEIEISDQDLTIDLEQAPAVFSDPDGDALVYSVSNSNAAFASVSISGSEMTISPASAGTAFITLTADDQISGTVSTDFMVTVYQSLDIGPPQTNQPREDQQVSIQLEVNDGALADQGTIFYRRGGDLTFSQDAMQKSGSQYSAVIPAGTVTSRGIEYYVEIADTTGRPVRKPNTGVAAIEVDVTDLESRVLRGGSAQNSYLIVSVPMRPNNDSPSALLEDDFGQYTRSNWRFFSVDNNDTKTELTDMEHIDPGVGYWLIVKEAGKRISTGPGKTTKTDVQFSVTLHPGWNLIGNPFNFQIPVTKLSMSDGQTVTLRTYQGGWNDLSTSPVSSLVPFEGYALHNESAQSVELLIDPDLSGSSTLKVASPRQAPEGAIWNVRIRARVQNSVDIDNAIGIHAGADEGFDVLDAPEPPPIGDYVTLYFPHSDWNMIAERFCSDFRGDLGEGQAWDFVVTSNIRDKIELDFEGVDQLSGDLQAILVDPAVNASYNLRENASLDVAAPAGTEKHLQLYIGTASFVAERTASLPVEFHLAQNYPNPFNPVTTIAYGLPEPDRVTIAVFNILGEKVTTLLDGELQQPGSHTVVWNGRGQQGRNAGSGVYIYKLTSSTHSVARKMVLVR